MPAVGIPFVAFRELEPLSKRRSFDGIGRSEGATEGKLLCQYWKLFVRGSMPSLSRPRRCGASPAAPGEPALALPRCCSSSCLFSPSKQTPAVAGAVAAGMVAAGDMAAVAVGMVVADTSEALADIAAGLAGTAAE